MNVTIPLIDYINLVTKNFNQYAIIDSNLALQIKSIDSQESLSHVESIKDSELFQLWHINDWKISIERREKQKQYSEIQRQIRFAEEQKIKDDEAQATEFNKAFKGSKQQLNLMLKISKLLMTEEME